MHKWADFISALVASGRGSTDLFYKNGEAGSAFEIHPMQLQEHGIWNYETKQSLHGIYYDFLLKIEGEQVQSADPYAKACGVNGLRSMAVDLRKRIL